jgi:hypothetical protein
MQADLKRGKAASDVRSRSVAILAGVPLFAILALFAPDRALAACGAASHPAHAAASSGGSVHTATSRPAAGGGGGAGGGSLGCAGGASAPAPRGLPTTASGRVVEIGAHAAHTTTLTRTATTKTAPTRTATTKTAPTRTTNASAHVHAVRPPHRA